MRRIFLFLVIIMPACFCSAQDAETDSLLALLKSAKEDSTKVNLLNQISRSYFNTSPENAIKFATQAKELAEKSGYKYGLAFALKNIGIGYYMQSDYVETLTYWNQSLKEFESMNDKAGIANILSNLGAVHANQGDDAKAIDYHLRSLKYAEETGDTLRIVTVLNNIGAVYYNKRATHDQAMTYYLRALPLCEKLGDEDAIGTITVNLGEIYLEKGDDSSALRYFERSLKAYENSKNIPSSLNAIGKVYEKRGDYATAFNYHTQALKTAEKLSAKLDITQSYLGLASTYSKKKEIVKAFDAYKKAEVIAKEIGASYELKSSYEGLTKLYAQTGNFTDAYKYQSLLNDIKDTLYNTETDKKVASLQFNFEIQKKQAEIDLLTNDKVLKELDLRRQTAVKNSLIAVLFLVTVIVFILFRNYRIKDRTNAILDHQKKELEQTLTELKTTQTQLIQSEKMASLGELTAGIAHEIQNPLNFVNNFSEVSIELADDLKDEFNTLNLQEADRENITALISDLVQNQEKINFHGKRAESIIVSMLQHSRSSTGKKEPTDINLLTDEYLRLSYHGLRAKDKTFNAEMKTSFADNIGVINVMPQDIGRVLINFYNNAFYAVTQKKKQVNEGYVPTVSVTTKKTAGKIEIRVWDNGPGIPEKVKEKIFQPFFTTKPTGQGTGLGLSMSYDIIKAHGGDIKINTQEGEFAEFIIELPAK